MLIWNKDQRPEAYDKIKTLFRPGHAGFTYLAKYGVSDYRGGGRSSGRETASRVAAGAVAKSILKEEGIQILAYTREVAGIGIRQFDESVIEKNPLRCPDPEAAKEMEAAVMQAKEAGDSVGGIVEIVVRNAPAGLGEPVFDKLEADLARALMSIGAVRGFEVGNGFAAARLRGSENNDPMYRDEVSGRIRTRSNNAGGIAGGISNGEEIVLKIAVKPASSIRKEQETVSVEGEAAKISVEGRHDPCICPRVVPVAESMVALTILDHLTRQHILDRQKPLRTLRDTIDLIDRNILLLLAERQGIVESIGATKRRTRKKIADPRRERQILKKQLPLARDLGVKEADATALFKTIFAMARRVQRRGNRT
jgi:chorismate synthase